MHTYFYTDSIIHLSVIMCVGNRRKSFKIAQSQINQNIKLFEIQIQIFNFKIKNYFP